MSWQPEVDEIARRRAFALAMGGEASLQRQHEAGKLSARERIGLLADPGSFREIGILTGSARYDDSGSLLEVTPANAIIGTARIAGRRAVISADDFSIRGGSSESTISDKWLYAERLALEMRLPLARLVDTAGGSVRILERDRATQLPGYASWEQSRLLAEVPVVGVALGSCAGLGAVKVCSSHFSVMVERTSQVFAAGPYVVREGLALDIDKEALGGAEVHARGSGLVDNAAGSEADAMRQVRGFLSYLPQSVHRLPERGPAPGDPERRDPWLIEAVPRDARKTYDTRRILRAVFDGDSIFEIGRYSGRSVITALARLNGYPVGVLANDPRHAGGAMTVKSSQKIESFVDLCDTFHLPMVSLFDQPGIMVGPDAERGGTVRYALRALAAIEQSRMPWITVVVRRAFGVAGAAHGRLGGINLRYAWPSASWGSIPLEGGIAAAYRRQLAEAPDPKALAAELDAKLRKYTSPFRTAERFGIHDVIDPRDTRPLLCDWAEMAYAALPGQRGVTRRTLRR